MPNRHQHQRRDDMTPDPHDQHTWKIVALLHEHAPWLYAGLAATVTAALRTYLDTGRITGRDICEWMICGIFVATSRPVWAMVGLGDEYGMFIGVIIGMVGARVLRVIAETAIKRLLSRFGGR